MSYVDLLFPVLGSSLPSDHGYALFSAISGVVPEAHGAAWLGVETIRGVARGDGTTAILPRATLRVRLPAEQISVVLPLAGRRLDVRGHAVRLGAPQVLPLRPAASLHARIVTIKGFLEPEPFLAAAGRQLDELGVKGELEFGPRRVLKVGEHKIVGFELGAHGLSADDSLTLQERGLGGRRRMGAGIFVPIRRLRGARPTQARGLDDTASDPQP